MTRQLGLLVLTLSLAACGSDSPAESTCKRADECNALRVSVKECVETIETALDQLTPTDADELEFQMHQCLDHPACDAFISCFTSLVDRESSGGGGPPPPPPPGPAGG